MDFREVITESVLADYLTAEYGHDLAVCQDGSCQIIESSLRWHSNQNAPVAMVKCPGIGNLDSTTFSNQFADRDESGIYLEIATGRVIGDLSDLINETCRNGDVSDFIDDLIDQLEESYRS